MRAIHSLPLILVFSLSLQLLHAQKNQRTPLTEPEIEQIREAGIDPPERIRLYVKLVDEHIDTIKGLTPRAHSAARVSRLDNELQDLTALMDELGANLDQYGDRKADLRKALKPLNEASQRWLDVLRALPAERGFDLSRKEALDSGQDLADQAAQMLKDQTAYFALHKDEEGQQRAEPQ